MFVICRVAVEFPKKSPQAGVRSRLTKGGGNDGKTPREHKFAELLIDGKLPVCPKKIPAA